MDKSKDRWKAIPHEKDWDDINKEFHLEDYDWDSPSSDSTDYYKRDKVRLSEFGKKSGLVTLGKVFGKTNTEATDNVNNPPHYQQGSQEVIDIIEGAIVHAPDPVTGMLQAQALKYLLRMWHKADPSEDAKKAQWYLNRMVTQL